MKALKTVYDELIGLFVEDGTLAVGILLWVGIVALVLARIPASHMWAGPVMFVGLVLLLVENVWRGAKQK